MIVKIRSIVQITVIIVVVKHRAIVSKLYGFAVAMVCAAAIAICNVIVMVDMDVTYTDVILEVVMEYVVHRLFVLAMVVIRHAHRHVTTVHVIV